MEGELAAEGEPAAAGEPNAPSARTLENSRRSKEARGEFTPPDTRSQLPRSGGAHIRKIRLTLSPLSLSSSRKLAASPPRDPWSRAAGNHPDDLRGQEVNTDDIRNSWTTAQRDVEDLSALRAHEEHQRAKIEEAETERRRREREESRAAAAKAKAKAKDDDGVIDLCDSDEDVVEVMKEEKGASRNGGGSNKENSPDDVEVIVEPGSGWRLRESNTACFPRKYPSAP